MRTEKEIRKYPIAPDGLFDSVQGEGELTGIPMHFVRLAGCSVGCPECDTDYSAAERLCVAEIAERLQRFPPRGWVWITGGEPTDHDLSKLVNGLKAVGYKTALATSGIREFPNGWAGWPCDFLSVSPHTFDGRWKQRTGTQINLVPGLNGLDPSLLPAGVANMFAHRYVTPLYGDESSLKVCMEFVTKNSGWRLGIQAHKVWGLP